MNCFSPCLLRARKVITCSYHEDEQFCSCDHIVPNSKVRDHKSGTVSRMFEEDNNFSSTTDLRSRHQNPSRSPCYGKQEPITGKGLVDYELEERVRRHPPTQRTDMADVKHSVKESRDHHDSITSKPCDFGVRSLMPYSTPKASDVGKLSTEKGRGSVNSRSSASIPKSKDCKAASDKGRSGYLGKHLGDLIPVVCIIEKATRRPVVEHEQLFEIMRKRPGWMIKPHNHSGEGWVHFQHWTKNYCDAKARLPYPNLRATSPEVLDSFVTSVNRQEGEKVFDVLSFCEKHGGSLQATTSFETGDKFCLSQTVKNGRDQDVHKSPKTPGSSEKSSVGSMSSHDRRPFRTR